MIKILIILLVGFFSIPVVNAQTYTTDTNLFENTYSNNLIDMANSQIENFHNKKYVIFEISDNYYLVSSNDISVSGNQVTMNNTEIIQATRSQDGYNYTYTYEKKEEDQSIVNINNIVVSNIDTNKSVTSKRYNDYKSNYDLKNIGIFILGLVLAIFITKERIF